MDRRDDDAGAIAWPGFVDILSSVMIMFLFFMLITSIVMFGLNIEYRKQLEKETQEKVSGQVSEEVREKLQEVLKGDESVEDILKQLEHQQDVEQISKDRDKLKHENVVLTNEVAELQKVVEQVRKDISEGEEQSTKIDKDNGLLILFSKNDVSLSTQTTEVVESYIQEVTKKLNGKKFNIQIITSDNPNAASISISREISLARSLNVRNVLIKQNIKTQDIDVSYSQPVSVDDSFNWLKVVVEVDDS